MGFAANKRKVEKEKEMARRFKREKLEMKVRAAEERTKRLLEAKHDLMQQRQKNQIRAQLQKQQLLESFQKLRLTRNWSQVAKQQQNRKFLPAAVGIGASQTSRSN